MIDYSFLPLTEVFSKGYPLNPLVEIIYKEQVHLVPGETYLQITNSPVHIALNSNYEVHIVDDCAVELEDVTSNVFIEQFIDSNGLTQIVWELINIYEYGLKPIALRFRSTINNQTFYTSLFVSSIVDSSFTTRFDYRHNTCHYGTEYDRANYTQSIRLNSYYDIPINESERQEYHQITTDVTVASRNINKEKIRYTLQNFDHFTSERLEKLLCSSNIYIDNVRHFNSTPLDYPDITELSNIFQGEMIVNPYYEDTFDFNFQIFQGANFASFTPTGCYNTGTQFTEFTITFFENITLNTGTVTVLDASDNSVIQVFTEIDMSVLGSVLTIDVTGSSAEFLSDGNYYVNVSEGLANVLGIPNDPITNSTDWTIKLIAGDYDSTDYNTTDYFTS